MSIQDEYNIKIGDSIGTLKTYENSLTIKTESINREIDYDLIQSISLKSEKKNELMISLRNYEVINLFLINLDEEKISKLIDDVNYQKSLNNKQINQMNINTANNTQLDNNELPLVIKADTNINKKILYTLDSYMNVKNNFSYLKDYFTFKGEFGVYEEHITIDNDYFLLKVPYAIIQTVEKKDLPTKRFIIKLTNEMSFQIKPVNTDKIQFRKIYNSILSCKIKHPIKPVVIKQNNNSQLKLYNPQQPLNYNPQQYLYEQGYPNNYSQQQYYNQSYHNRPFKQKSKLIAAVLHIIFPGLAYAYVKRWGKLFLIPILLFLFGFVESLLMGFTTLMIFDYYNFSNVVWFFEVLLIIIPIIMIIIWIYALIDSINMVDKYNRGRPY